MGGIIDLKVKTTSFVLDPGDFDPSKVTRTPVAKPTEGPHRYTIYVPHDERARISIGQAHPVKGEDGVAVETKSHIHLWTHDKESEGVATYMHLGKRSSATGYEVNQNGDGFALYTTGGSSQVAVKALSLVSQEDAMFLGAHGNLEMTSTDHGIALSAKHTIMATAGQNIELCAGKEEEIEFSFADKVFGVGLLAFETFDFLAPLGKHAGETGEHAAEAAEGGAKAVSLFTGMVENNASKWKEKFIATHAKTASKVLKHAEAITGLVLGFKKTMKKSKKAEHGWEEKAVWFNYGAEAVTKLVALANAFSPQPEEEGKVKIKGTNGVTVDTDKDVSIYAANNVSLAGFMGNSITGLGCTVKAYKDVSIWGGMGAAVKSLAGDVEMTTDFGEANVKGHKGVEVSSGEGDVKITGEKNVQLNSVKAKAVIHGKEGAYIGAGPGAGHGLIAKDSTLYLGCLKTVEKFNTVSVDLAEDCITMNKSLVAVKNGGDHKLEIQKSGVRLMGSKIEVKAQANIKIQGATVNIN